MAAPRASVRPLGTVTRGTTNPNRLRRMDRWIAATHGAALRRAPSPVAVDLGYGAAPWTAVELLARLRTVAPRVRVVGVEIEPARVAAAKPYEREGLTFRHGGFEVPVPERPTLIRAANVLRQYDEAEVADVWARLCARLAPATSDSRCTFGGTLGGTPGGDFGGGLLVEGTCDEIGRRHVWVALGPEGPRTVTFATRLGSLDRPSDLAERLPKALIHRNIPGEPVHAFLRDFDRAWAGAAPYASYGARQRWIRAVRDLTADWPVTDGPTRWRQGEVTVAWGALAPRR
ncbi:class I SAM-dependent methyltransferase [Streptomyces sp. SID12501]|uniref:Class I SAM-dependent methyltransferase n=1 Tax=Streptomyces sp. SID12501 TaxID=2706042 RepID=A0A6B3C7Y4_9ACTN|nr:class I SAM-dependent methyltransferase [Streptomyces sp. SID12501]NEC92482.1 class I SAM-dependent methyltransferase [Streptomyces sp. SID12501]